MQLLRHNFIICYISTYHIDSRYFSAIIVRRTDDVSIIVFVDGVSLAAGLSPVLRRRDLRLGHLWTGPGSRSADALYIFYYDL